MSYRFINGSTLLHTACYFSHFPAVKRLLKLGVNPDVRDYQGKTALHRTRDVKILQVSYLPFLSFICNLSIVSY
jgi:ankyrin repeat protein